MKKLAIAAAAVAALALPSLASAQTGVINATATIQDVLNFGTSQAVDFGAVVPGTASSVAFGYIELNRNVRAIVTLPDAAATGRLTREGGTETIQPAYQCGVGTVAGAITDAFDSCAPTDGTTQVHEFTAPTATTKDVIVFKGQLTATQTDVVPGTYTGKIRITVATN